MTHPLVIARSAATKQSRSALQVLVKVAPFWIDLIDKLDLLLARAGLYLFLARDGARRIVSRLIIDGLETL
jgi:hypothetical protein